MNNKYIIKVILIMLISSLAQAGKEPKNLKVLKFKTNKETTKYMKSVTKDLGVKCKYCHDMKDKSKDTDHKIVAREMMRMTMDLNKNFFIFLEYSINKNSESIVQISCWTCHQGSQHPQLSRP